MPSNPKDSKWRSTPANKRARKAINLTLSDEARDKLDRLESVYGSRSAAAEAGIMLLPEKE
jgi:hypothetical protein